MRIDKLQAYEILDSRGTPTLEVALTSGKIIASASVPSGVSTGANEAAELRDGDQFRYNGKGVLKAVFNVNKIIAEKIVGNNIGSQKKLDNFLIKLDGTENKSNLGANAILGVSLSFAKAMAQKKNLELYEYFAFVSGINAADFNIPMPSLLMIEGGRHSDSGLDIQEFMIQPVGIKSYAEQLRAGSEIYHTLKTILSSRNYAVSVGDEGGFAPCLKSNNDAIEIILEAIAKAGYSADQIKIGLDAAASSFYNDGKYIKKNKEGSKEELSADEMTEWYKEIINKYPISFIEDGFEENDWKGFSSLTEKFGDKIIIVGDDLLVTNIKIIKKAIKKKAVNSVVIKPNQIGTVTETIKAIMLAKSQKWVPFVSQRGGETEDNYIADLAVGCACQLFKAGAPCRSERLAKYNRLLKIEAKLFASPAKSAGQANPHYSDVSHS